MLDLGSDELINFLRLGASALALAAPAYAAAQDASFDPARLSRHVQTLGSDAYEGRAPATRGETKTVAYLTEQFRAAGLQPGGDLKDGKRQWTQAVPLLKSDIAGTPHLELRTATGAMPLTQGEQIAVRAPLNGQKQVAVNDAPLVFVGYGVDGARAQLGRLQGRRRARQDHRRAGQRPRLRRRRTAISAARR